MPSSRAPALFGYLEQDGCGDLACGRYQILEGRELLIGRDYKTCNVVLTDPTVSKQHLLIYSVAYLEDSHQRIFVYAKDLSTNGTYWSYKHGNNWKELLIGNCRAVLLSDGDRVRLCDGSSFAFRHVHRRSDSSEDASTIQNEDTKLFKNLFRITERKLGSGAFGEVWMAVDVAGKRQMACKMVKWGKSPQRRSGIVSFSRSLWREVELLKDISHPNIIHVERVFFTEENLYIISDLVTGGDLMSYIERAWTNIDDAEACIIIYQILKALECLHRQGICHRDLKPENILMSTPARGARVILADFGHSIKLHGGKEARSRRMKTASVGTDYYVAPEIRSRKKNAKGYTMATDMWSVGIITALLLTGEFIFETSGNMYASPVAVVDAAAECDLSKLDHDTLWQTVNLLGKGFIKSLLVLDENARLEVGQALRHGWFANEKPRENIQQEYEDVIRGWMPSRPLLDFKEDLAVFRDGGKSTLDSISKPPPAIPTSKRLLQHSSHQWKNGQQSSPFFPRAIRVDATILTVQAGKKRGLALEDETHILSDSPKQAITANKRQNKGSRVNNNLRHESENSPKSSAKQVVGREHVTLFQFGSSQRIQPPSADLDYEERRLYNRVSREEASIFITAKSYGKCIENRRKFGLTSASIRHELQLSPP